MRLAVRCLLGALIVKDRLLTARVITAAPAAHVYHVVLSMLPAIGGRRCAFYVKGWIFPTRFL